MSIIIAKNNADTVTVEVVSRCDGDGALYLDITKQSAKKSEVISITLHAFEAGQLAGILLNTVEGELE